MPARLRFVPAAVEAVGDLSALTLEPTVTATVPYLATIFPLEGIVPSGQIVLSPDDTNLRSNVIAAWPDNSARVVVIAGNTNVTSGVPKVINLQSGAASGTDLTPDRVVALVSTVKINFGAGEQTLTLTNSNHERIWWQNPEYICCRYRLAAAVGVLEAVIDVHAFKTGANDRAFVEVVTENCKVDASLSSVSNPANGTYTNATIKINDTTILTISSSSGSNGTHGAGRAFYCSASIIDGVVTVPSTAEEKAQLFGVEVVHDTASLQAHPMFTKIWKATDQNLQTLYQNDAYEPWAVERLNVPNMGQGGDVFNALGSFTQWDTRYIQSGSKYARRASIATALAALTCNINWRDQTTGLVPTFTQVGNKEFQHSTWPNGGGEPAWEESHSPAVGLMGFLCRPSPCFIEIAQKAALWQHQWRNFQNTHPVIGNGYEVRAKCWTMRAWNHACFITPDTMAWKASALGRINDGIVYLDLYRTDSKQTLGFVWPLNPENPDDSDGYEGLAGFRVAMWQHHYLLVELHKIAACKTLSGAEHTLAVQLADWAALQPIRHINESVSGEWRCTSRYLTVVDASKDLTTMEATWNERWANLYGGSPPAATGQWLGMHHDFTPQLWSNAADETDTTGEYYDTYFWAAFCIAVERAVSGADAAWTKVLAGITNLDSGGSPWSAKLAAEPRWGWYPRNK